MLNKKFTFKELFCAGGIMKDGGKVSEGEWKVERDGQQTWKITTLSKIMRLADVHADPIGGSPNSRISIEEAEANAHLMGASKQMYEALKLMLGTVEAHGLKEFDKSKQLAKRALLKAQGE